MSLTVLTVAQRSPAWFAARLGRVTGSRAADVLARVKTGEAAARREYRAQLVCERLTGQPQEPGYVSADMQHGVDTEPRARAAYEADTGSLVTQTGFLAHDTLMVGGSLDGHIGAITEGLIEIKCPKTTTHLEALETRAIPARYRPQLVHHLWLTGAQWIEWVSFDDRLPAALELVRVRVTREAAAREIATYADAVTAFLAEVDRTVAALTTGAA